MGIDVCSLWAYCYPYELKILVGLLDHCKNDFWESWLGDSGNLPFLVAYSWPFVNGDGGLFCDDGYGDFSRFAGRPHQDVNAEVEGVGAVGVPCAAMFELDWDRNARTNF